MDSLFFPLLVSLSWFIRLRMKPAMIFVVEQQFTLIFAGTATIQYVLENRYQFVVEQG